jgi:hypothetical protein
MTDHRRAFKPSAHGNMDLMFSTDGQVDAGEIWASALPWDSESTIYTQRESTSTSRPSTQHSSTGHFEHNLATGVVLYQDKCDSPECGEPECHEPDCTEELVECTDPYCLPAGSCTEGDICHSRSTKCAGELALDIVTAAASLAAMKPPTLMNGQYYQSAPHNYDFCAALAGGYTDNNHPAHFGACMFTNAYNVPAPYENGNMVMQGQDMCHFINNTNFCQSHDTYHNPSMATSFQNSTLQYAMSLRDLSSRSSSSQDAQLFAFSHEPTPSSASTYSSPHQTSSDQMIYSTPKLIPDHGNSLVPTCQWCDGNGAPCGLSFNSKAELQSHIQTTHTAPLSKGIGFVCRWQGCSRLVLSAEKAGFAQRSKLDRHMQSHTGRELIFFNHIFMKSD